MSEVSEVVIEEKKTKSALSLVMGYYRQQGQKVSEIKAEVDALTADSKLELARLIAKAQGLSQEDVNFPLE
ncbi:MAG: hypothetical protein HY445_00680 [Candidatus Niyogibacteria bacterium]|nr:hypothetical protein [Candidatus Niyogibacteria bacterium]